MRFGLSPHPDTLGARVRQSIAIRWRLLRNPRMTVEGISKELHKLIRILGENRAVKQLSDHPGWQQVEHSLVQHGLACNRQVLSLAEAVVSGQKKKEELAMPLAEFKAVNYLLGLVNETLLESARTQRLINSKLAVQERLEEEQRRAEKEAA